MKRTLGIGMMLLAALPVAAQDDDGPGRGVARLSLITGDVSVRRGDTGEWVAAAVNGPLVVGDRVLSGAGSRAEVQLDWANLARLGSNTEIRLSELEQGRFQIQLARGMMTFAVLRESDAEVDISTPSVSVRPVRRGLYRISVREDATGPITEIAVRAGEVEVFSPRGSQRLRSGRTMLVRGNVADPEFQNVADLPDDNWDEWNERRDRELLRSSSYKYVNRDIYGADDLDAYGGWVNAAPYGWVWQPRVAPGWAPYRYGRWSWVDYYGWSWLSYDPWGWAPYHYGRWFWHANRWSWWPGAIGARTWWRPALVAWVGWGGGFGGGLGVGIGAGWGWGRVGWIPLAPYEPFHAWYGQRWYGRGGNSNRTTIVNNINVTNIYRNARVNNGVTVVQADNFGRGSVNALRVSSGELERVASARGGPLPVVPDRAATRMADREVRAGALSPSPGNERFYSRRAASTVDRVPFEDQRRGVEQVARNTFGDRPTGASGERLGRAPDGFARGEGANAANSTGDASRRVASDDATPQRIANDGRTAGGRAENVRSEGGASPRQVSEGSRTGLADAANDGSSSRSSAGVGGGRVASESQNGWRRFGEPRTGAASANDAVRGATGFDRSASTRTEGWRRRGDASSGSGSAIDTPAAGRSSGGGNGNETAGRNDAMGGRTLDRTEGRTSGRTTERTDGWRTFGSAQPDSGVDRSDRSSRFERQDRSAPGRSQGSEMRVNPPIIQDRGSSSQSRGSSGDFRSSGRDIPRSDGRQAPPASSPRYEGQRNSGGGSSPRMSTPRSSGGGGASSTGGRTTGGSAGSRSSGGRAEGGSRSSGGGRGR